MVRSKALGDSDFAVDDIVAHRPIALVVDHVRELLLFRCERGQIPPAFESGLLHPEGGGTALHVGDGDRVALSLLEWNRGDECVLVSRLIF